ncbi:Fe-Mn family superoxide dismutase [Novosphingobium hassiacum]|uniref:Superoxide dismutase n=1 Tax=Novosphingobium hassiacum TaxID=173676 RepID=A0A7W5ZZ91_9SPHN|nr:superoxide dismutase [Novosphingobium hassiacum]MBB3862241.1 Fe-Mn family superoxide dismutase [Novosphingobium hassiacum]
MAIQLPPLPYADDALAPAISATTLQTHHGKHHKAYVDKTNAAIAGTDLADATLEQIIASAQDKGDKGLFNNSAQAWNHAFYWNSLTPASSQPTGELLAALEASFGSFDAVGAELEAQGTAHFASGWVWLVARGEAITVEQTHDAATFATGDAKPILVIDLWEHAYYLDHKNLRPEYLKAVIARHLNWDFASENFDRDGVWTYPG